MTRLVLALLIVAACGGSTTSGAPAPAGPATAGPATSAAPARAWTPTAPAGDAVAADEAEAEADEAEADDDGDGDLPRCYPYQARPDGTCLTTCARREDCQGSRGPGDFAEHGWPLDCINRACVPLPPDHVHPRS